MTELLSDKILQNKVKATNREVSKNIDIRIRQEVMPKMKSVIGMLLGLTALDALVIYNGWTTYKGNVELIMQIVFTIIIGISYAYAVRSFYQLLISSMTLTGSIATLEQSMAMNKLINEQKEEQNSVKSKSNSN